MNNTLNPCKCSGDSGGGNASDILYDGLSVDCLPGLVGQNLAMALKRIGDQACDNSGSSSPTYTQDQNVPNTGAASYLNTTYPDAKVGDQVYSIGTTQRRTWTCFSPGAWSRIDETLES